MLCWVLIDANGAMHGPFATNGPTLGLRSVHDYIELVKPPAPFALTQHLNGDDRDCGVVVLESLKKASDAVLATMPEGSRQ